MRKLSSGSTAPVFGTRSRTCPYDARISKSLPRYFLSVFAFDGDSTMSRFDAMDVPGFFLFYNAVRGRLPARLRRARIDALEEASRERGDTPFELEARDARGEFRDREAGAHGELLEGHRIECHRRKHGIACFGRGTRGLRRRRRRERPPSE